MVIALIEYLTALLEYIDWQKLGGPGPCHTQIWHVTARYTCVSAILKVLSLDFNTPLFMFTGTYDKLVDKRMFTTLLMQLKAAVLVKVYHKTNCRSLIALHK